MWIAWSFSGWFYRQVNKPYDTLVIYKEHTFTYKMCLSEVSVFFYNMHMQHRCMCIFSQGDKTYEEDQESNRHLIGNGTYRVGRSDHDLSK